VVRALIEAGADVNKAIYNGVTPLHIAAQRGHHAVVRALLAAGAVNARQI
jgi:cytohesin